MPRQEALAAAPTGTPLLLSREPDNPADPQAVRVDSIHGPVGYVPAGETVHFEHAVAAGYISWCGIREGIPASHIGAEVAALPALRAAHIAVLPRRLSPLIDLSAALPPRAWASLEARVADGAFGRCQMTGAEGVRIHPEQEDSPTLRLRAHPTWSVLERERVIRLSGFLALSLPAILALNYLDLEVLAQQGAPSPSPETPASTGPVFSEGTGLAGGLAENAPPWLQHSTAATWRGTGSAAGTGTGGAVSGQAAQAQRSQRGRRGVGTVAQLIGELRGAYGSLGDHAYAMRVARAAARDALRFANSAYVAEDGEEGGTGMAVAHQRHWTMVDVHAYVQACWKRQEVMGYQDYAVDLSHLFEMDNGFMHAHLSPTDLPSDLQQVLVGRDLRSEGR